jgi:hypothetical protein
MKKLLRRGKEKFQCTQDQSGKLMCRSFREFEDGTREELAGIDFSFDANCKGVADAMWENEPGALDRLEKKAYNRIQEKCRSTKNPSDY